VSKTALEFLPVDLAPLLKSREQEWLRRMGGPQGLVRMAAEGKPEPLILFLLDGDTKQLSAEDRLLVRDFLLGSLPLPPQGAHRPRGSLKPINAATKFC
jgi:hypothetical protein